MILKRTLPCVIRHPETKALCGKVAFIVPDGMAVGPVCNDCALKILAAWSRDVKECIMRAVPKAKEIQ